MSRIIGLLQVDSTVGDLAGNAKRLESLANTAKINGAKLAVATELAISVSYTHLTLPTICSV